MAMGDGLKKRSEELAQRQQNLKLNLAKAQESAIRRAVKVATEATPPNDGGLAGTNTRSGQLADHWSLDSQMVSKNGVVTLANNMQYASYINDGHRMDRHFVMGLIVNGGMIEQTDEKEGIVVGTKTTYVEGKYMREKALKEYSTVLSKAVSKVVKELFK